MARRLDASVPDGWMGTIPAQERPEPLAADPSDQPWLVRAVVRRAPRRVVGNVGFHGPPDEQGRVEIGYGKRADGDLVEDWGSSPYYGRRAFPEIPPNAGSGFEKLLHEVSAPVRP